MKARFNIDAAGMQRLRDEAVRRGETMQGIVGADLHFSILGLLLNIPIYRLPID